MTVFEVTIRNPAIAKLSNTMYEVMHKTHFTIFYFDKYIESSNSHLIIFKEELGKDLKVFPKTFFQMFSAKTDVHFLLN